MIYSSALGRMSTAMLGKPPSLGFGPQLWTFVNGCLCHEHFCFRIGSLEKIIKIEYSQLWTAVFFAISIERKKYVSQKEKVGFAVQNILPGRTKVVKIFYINPSVAAQTHWLGVFFFQLKLKCICLDIFCYVCVCWGVDRFSHGFSPPKQKQTPRWRRQSSCHLSNGLLDDILAEDAR